MTSSQSETNDGGYIKFQIDQRMTSAQPLARAHNESRLSSRFRQLSAVSGKIAKISVVTTCFNYRQYIAHAINSALAQSLAPCELIVVDDGSTDGSAELLKERFGHMENIQIVSTPNRGQLAAICEGFHKSSGDIIALLDADDTWDPNYLERVWEHLSKDHSVDFVSTNMKFFGAKEGGIWNDSMKNIDFGLTSCLTALSDPPPWLGSATSGLSIRKALFERLLPSHELLCDWKTRADDCLVLGGSILGAHKFYIADRLVNYRIHDRNQTRGWSEDWSPAEACQYEIRRQRMLSYYRYKAYGAAKPSVHILHLEFKSTDRPSLQRLWKYICLLPRTSGNKLAKLKVSLMIMKYWWKQLF
jgi:glycosyltransferase involved in cell wall biosynthesis